MKCRDLMIGLTYGFKALLAAATFISATLLYSAESRAQIQFVTDSFAVTGAIVGSEAEVAFDGVNYLAAYTLPDNSIEGQFIDITGNNVGLPFNIVPSTEMGYHPAIAYGAGKYLIVYSDDSPSSRLYGRFVSTAGVVSEPIIIANAFSYPSVEFGNSDFMVVWALGDIFAQRVNPDGTLNGPQIAISAGARSDNYPSLAFDGVNYLVIWASESYVNALDSDIYAARVSESGSLLDSNSIVVSATPGAQGSWRKMGVAYGTNAFLVAWEDLGGSTRKVYGRRIGPDGVPIDTDRFAIATNPAYGSAGPRVGFDGTDWLVAWSGVTASRVGQDGAVLDFNGVLVTSGGSTWDIGAELAFDGTNFLVIGTDGLGAPYTLYGRIISTLPTSDADKDGMDDDWEMAHFGNLSHDGTADGDGDGLTDLEEFQEGTNPLVADTDGDGYNDGREVALGSDPTIAGSYPAGYVPDVERAALVDLYNSTNGSGWTNTNWLTGAGECTWYGVTCVGNHVSRIQLESNNLAGVIPASIGNITRLQRLYLNQNNLSGNIPTELGNLVNLQHLVLRGNLLSGSIPAALGGLSNLQLLGFNNNQLSGSIPAALGNLSNLQSLELDSNQLSGSILAALGNLTNLQQLSVYNNQLSGSIPAELGNLANLQLLRLNSNQLNGSIPAALGNLVNLQLLQLSGNQLSGGIPTELGALANLQGLYLDSNQLSGGIPAELGALAKLQVLYLDSNHLSGSIPGELGALANLRALSLAYNRLSGSIPAALGSLTNLQTLGLFYNQLSEGIPAELGNLANLQWLGLFNNQLSGSIPAELGNLANLQYLYLESNQLSGSIPAELGNLDKLESPLLSSNRFAGEMPTSLDNLTKLNPQYTDFRWNALHTSDNTLRAFLNSKQTGGDWESTQTVAPANLSATVLSGTEVRLNWTPIAYTANSGYYEICRANASGGACASPVYSSPKSTNTATVGSLNPGTTYYFKVRTATEPHSNNANTVISEWASEVAAATSVGTVDNDGDGMPDDWETLHGVSDPHADADGDGLSNLAEYLKGTDPNNPDTDGDGVPDGNDAFPLDPSASIDDRLPPTSAMTEPAPGATSAPIGTNIVIHVRDGLAGVDGATIVMQVNAVVVFNGANPAAYPNTEISGGPSDYTLTYNPPADFGYSQTVTATVSAMDVAGNVLTNDTHSFQTAAQIGDPWDPAGDDDNDGIPNEKETLLGTNPNKKTLFIRPKMWSGSQFVYWSGFKDLFPDARGAGFANIPAFTNAGIEISVIGDPFHPYAPMRAFTYDPATDANHPPCDIVEIVHMPDTAFCSQGHYNFGHTYFFTSSAAWYWDTKGYVPNDQTAYQKYKYFTAYIYPLAVDTYLTEGAYPSILKDVMPTPTTPTNCGLNQCYVKNLSSPLNLNATDPVAGRPDLTVEFNQIIFNSSKQIIFVGDRGQPYDRNAIMRRTIAHELGHTLMAASESDHCSDPQCIMYGSTADWEMRDFGPGNSCVHKPGGAKDIRATGIIHNRVH